MPAEENPLDRARVAAVRVVELEELARERDAWTRETERLEREVADADDELGVAVAAASRAATAARAERGFLAKVRNRIAGHAESGDDERGARADSEEAATNARQKAAQATLRGYQGTLDDARRRKLLADGAVEGCRLAKLAERKIFAALPATGDDDLDAAVRELATQERRCDAWRSARRAAIARRDHTTAALTALGKFESAWPAMATARGDVVRGEAGPPPAASLEALRQARHELYLGARAGVPGLGAGVLGEIGSITAHEIERPEKVRHVAAILTRALQELEPIAEAAAKNNAELEVALSQTDSAAVELRAKIHKAILL
jgi:hypothetical protein